MESLYGHEKFLADGSAIFVLGEWVVKIDLLANRLTCWPRTPICWPTRYNWRVGYNTSFVILVELLT